MCGPWRGVQHPIELLFGSGRMETLMLGSHGHTLPTCVSTSSKTELLYRKMEFPLIFFYFDTPTPAPALCTQHSTKTWANTGRPTVCQTLQPPSQVLVKMRLHEWTATADNPLSCIILVWAEWSRTREGERPGLKSRKYITIHSLGHILEVCIY